MDQTFQFRSTLTAQVMKVYNQEITNKIIRFSLHAYFYATLQDRYALLLIINEYCFIFTILSRFPQRKEK